MEYCSVGTVDFPAASGINVNMMPMIMGDHDSLPQYLHTYSSLLDACDVESQELGQVGYLTVMETSIAVGRSQRRGGIHTERHPVGGWGGGGWGGGCDEWGGLYMASNMTGTTAVWDRRIETPGPGGDIDWIRSELGDPYVLSANELIWMTDACPHESLPVNQIGTRQFFRLVTSQIDLWYTENSTTNPLGIIPPDHVRLITQNKFEMNTNG